MELLYALHRTYYLLLYLKSTLFQIVRAVITKLTDIPVFLFFSSLKVSFIIVLFISFTSRKNIFYTLSVYRLFLRNTGRNRKDLRGDIMKFFDWFFPENRD